MEELQDKFSDPKIIGNILTEAKINPKIIELVNEEAMCETFHKLPKDIREMSIFDYDVYCAILGGRQEAMRNKSKS